MIPSKEILQEVFGEYFDIAQNVMDEYGWINRTDYYTYFPQNIEIKQLRFDIFKRPKELENYLPYFVSGSCKGEICSVCGAKATNKLGEEIPRDDPDKMRHNLTGYVCREHFTMIVGGCH